jgi:putative transposase
LGVNLLYIPAVIGARLLLLALLRLLVRFALVFVFTQPPAVRYRRSCLRAHVRQEDSVSLPRDASGHWRATPLWAEREILRLAVFVRSCRRVADAFNAIHGHRRTIGKSTVAKICRAHATEIATRRRRMRRTPPAAVPVRTRWSLDLSFAGDPELAQPNCILGILDQGSRALLRLRALPRKCTWTLLGHLCLTIAEHGLPESIRADNESMFTSRLWKAALRLAGIRRERIRVRHPWQNGRVERCFGTLKAALRDVATHGVILKGGLQGTLDEFASFYNHVRVHQGLAGLTPAQAWRGLTLADVRRHAGRGRWVQALGGVLLGYHIRC